ncbi:MAG: MmgE/PrpD family protein [Betaproteobacteria bacterium]|nr:MmgE/PrpD family protein [Betaproteobacteria bacterium]
MNDAVQPTLSTPSSRLVDFLLSLTTNELPSAVVREARIRLLDGLGCGLYGAVMPWGRIAAQVVYDEQSRGRATIYGSRVPAAPARAALVNGTATHGIELDDIVPGAHVHPGAVVIPAALATAEQHEAPGARLLLGLIAGYEAMARVGLAIGEAGWGFHITGIAGPVGAAVASGVTLGMPHEQIMRAIGIACSSAAGIKSFTQGSGGMIKRMHAGRAAESGVLACALAHRGFTAPLAALDGRFGLLEVYGGDKSNPQALDRDLGTRYAVSRVWTKVYPCCGVLHTTAQALHALRVEHGIEHGAIKSVRVGTNKRAIALNGEVAPKETMAAQYSMPFTAAVALVRDPKDPRFYTGDALDDPAVCGLARRIELYADPEMEALYPRYGTRAEVRLADGRTLETKLLDAHGTPADPCTEDEAKEKFRCLAAVTNSGDSIAEVLSLAERLETLPSVAPLSKALRAGVSAR